MSGMGRTPSQKQVNQMMKSMQKIYVSIDFLFCFLG